MNTGSLFVGQCDLSERTLDEKVEDLNSKSCCALH